MEELKVLQILMLASIMAIRLKKQTLLQAIIKFFQKWHLKPEKSAGLLPVAAATASNQGSNMGAGLSASQMN